MVCFHLLTCSCLGLRAANLCYARTCTGAVRVDIPMGWFGSKPPRILPAVDESLPIAQHVQGFACFCHNMPECAMTAHSHMYQCRAAASPWVACHAIKSYLVPYSVGVMFGRLGRIAQHASRVWCDAEHHAVQCNASQRSHMVLSIMQQRCMQHGYK
jgi:hypothetical protein